ncbi:hypothetical protein SAMN06297387_10732 [Streptomyces zhaozhouensis]|uniref:Uncharacterized protein n=1 Tax=Streptomyces zhaozhouensis TaxID=1300267 RepID=A0A286DVF0_9ACTN|nr:hypothetical protein SAMN06297387_10732 [Streptomyces zhaozhouensis]
MITIFSFLASRAHGRSPAAGAASRRPTERVRSSRNARQRSPVEQVVHGSPPPRRAPRPAGPAATAPRPAPEPAAALPSRTSPAGCPFRSPAGFSALRDGRERLGARCREHPPRPRRPARSPLCRRVTSRLSGRAQERQVARAVHETEDVAERVDHGSGDEPSTTTSTVCAHSATRSPRPPEQQAATGSALARPYLPCSSTTTRPSPWPSACTPPRTAPLPASTRWRRARSRNSSGRCRRDSATGSRHCARPRSRSPDAAPPSPPAPSQPSPRPSATTSSCVSTTAAMTERPAPAPLNRTSSSTPGTAGICSPGTPSAPTGGPSAGLLHEDGVLETGGPSLPDLAGFLLSLDVPFTVIDPPELRDVLLALADRCAAAGGNPPRPRAPR